VRAAAGLYYGELLPGSLKAQTEGKVFVAARS